MFGQMPGQMPPWLMQMMQQRGMGQGQMFGQGLQRMMMMRQQGMPARPMGQQQGLLGQGGPSSGSPWLASSSAAGSMGPPMGGTAGPPMGQPPMSGMGTPDSGGYVSPISGSPPSSPMGAPPQSPFGGLGGMAPPMQQQQQNPYQGQGPGGPTSSPGIWGF